MSPANAWWLAVWIGASVAGCGLTLDLDPPDRDARAPEFDAGRQDAGIDGGGDAAPDGGPECECADTIDCTIDSCNPITGACEHAPSDAGCPGDGLDCTIERCDEVAGCVADLRHEICDDSLFCTLDACDPTAGRDDGCRHDPADERCGEARCDPALGCEGTECIGDADCVLGPCHLSASCADGRCERLAAPEGTACNDGDPCTPESACVAGECRGRADPICPGRPCFRCNSEGAGCDGSLTAPPGTSCDDRDACTAPDACMGATCTGPSISCDDDNECTTDRCDAATGCERAVIAGAMCDDANPCTDVTTCRADGRCLGRPRCPASMSPCTSVTCRPTDGTCMTTPLDGTPCPGGMCTAGVCTPTTCGPDTVECADGLCCDAFHAVCNPFAGCDACNADEFACPCEATCYPRTCRGAPGCCDTCAPTSCQLFGVTCDPGTQFCCECDAMCYDRTCTGPGCCDCAT